MPPKSTSKSTPDSKPGTRAAKPKGAAPEHDDEVTPSAAKKAPPAKKAEALSLINEDGAPKKRAPRKEGSALPPLGARPLAKSAAPAEAKTDAPAKKTIAEVKMGALDLLDEKEKARAKRKAEGEAGTAPAPSAAILPPISILKAGPAEAPPPPPPPPPSENETTVEVTESGEKIIHLKPPIIVKELAEKIGVKPFKLISELIAFKVFANADKAIDIDVAEKICQAHGFKLEREKREKGAGIHKVEAVIVEPPPPKPEEEVREEFELRAPIITFMGHVDHGKTSLMDAIRKTQVVAGEAGGITQHIGAYSVEYKGKPITFLDTPGHAAFSAMRARGANVTDIVVIVIAADDGIMPQTKEAISHAKAANVTIMVAINKCDLPAANVMRVKSQLQDIGLATVDWGGHVECVEVSATKGMGLDDLLETMALQAEVLELTANPKALARATVIESSMQPGKGPAATVIVKQGTLKVGQPFICGPHWGKVKALMNEHGDQVKVVKPGMPAEVIGFSDSPNVGDELVGMENERGAKRLSEERLEELRQKKLQAPRRSTLEALFATIEEGEKKELRLVIKGDVQGSVEAIVKCLKEIKSDKVSVEILHNDTGAVSESDILLASASDAVVIGFNVKVENKALAVAKREGVQVKLYSIIYELVDQVKESMLGLLDPLTRETVLGHAKVKQVFKLTKGRVAGCIVTDGRIDRKARARITRGGQAVYDGGIETLKRFQDEVPEVRNGLECGIKLGTFNDYEEGDVIECYSLEKFAQTL